MSNGAYNKGGDLVSTGEAPVARAVRESIDAVAAPNVRARILSRALHMAREHQIPEAGAVLESFVERHLYASTEFHLGQEAADSVMRTLAPILKLAKTLGKDGAKPVSRTHATTRKVSREELEAAAAQELDDLDITVEFDEGTKEYPTLRPNRSTVPLLMFVSASAIRCQEVSQHLGDAVSIQPITDAVSFLDNVQATSSLNPVIVIDCIEPSVRPATLASLIQDLSDECTIVLWGASQEELKDLGKISQHTKGWLRCEREAKAANVASMVRMLIGQ